MNMKDISIFLGVAFAAFYLLNRRGVKAAFTTEISNTALPGQTGYGWRYFSDGTAIDPNGNYYLKGAPIYTASYDGVSVGANYTNLTI